MTTKETIKAKSISIATQAGADPISYEEIAQFAYGREATAIEVAYVKEVLREANLPNAVDTRPATWSAPKHHPSEGPHPDDKREDLPYCLIEDENGEIVGPRLHSKEAAFRVAYDMWTQSEAFVTVWYVTEGGSLDYTLLDEEAGPIQLFECVICGFHADEDGVTYDDNDEVACFDCIPEDGECYEVVMTSDVHGEDLFSFAELHDAYSEFNRFKENVNEAFASGTNNSKNVTIQIIDREEDEIVEEVTFNE